MAATIMREEVPLADGAETRNLQPTYYAYEHKFADGSEGRSAAGGLLFDATDLVSDLVDAVLELRNVEFGQLEEIQIRFDLWADGVEVTSGRLDTLIGASRELKESISLIWLSFLRNLVKDESAAFYRQIVAPHLNRIDGLIEKISFLNETGTEFLKPLARKAEESSPQRDSVLQDDVTNFISIFDNFQRQLSRIAPFVLEFLRDCDHKNIVTFLDDEDTEGDLDNEGASEPLHKVYDDLKPQDWYRNSIQERFPEADAEVSQIIARELWELYRNVKLTLQPESLLHTEISQTQKAETVVEHDSTYESMQKSLAASLIRPSPRRIEIALIDIASDFSSSSCQLKDRPQVPSPPEGVELGPGATFKCQFCLQTVSDIDSSKKWRKHVLSDIRPYFCTFPGCSSSTVRYKSKIEWMTHEVQSHRLISSWNCNFTSCETKFGNESRLLDHLILEHDISNSSKTSTIRDLLNTSRVAELDTTLSSCRICKKELPNRVSRLASHIGRHLEDFALPILSQLDDREQGSAGEEDSEGNSSSSEILDGVISQRETLEPQHYAYFLDTFGIDATQSSGMLEALAPLPPLSGGPGNLLHIPGTLSVPGGPSIPRPGDYDLLELLLMEEPQYSGDSPAPLFRPAQAREELETPLETPSQTYCPLTVKDALSYLDKIKTQFAERPDIYNEFLDIMRNFKSQKIDAPGAIEQVVTLFAGETYLLQGFNTFLPPDYQIECSSSPSGSNSVSVVTPQGRTTVALIQPPPYFLQGTTATTSMQSPSHSPQDARAPADAALKPMGDDLLTKSEDGKSGFVGFNDAIAFINKVKERFPSQSKVYRDFLDILQRYQRESLPLQEAYSQVSQLFGGEADLMEGFHLFLPLTTAKAAQGPEDPGNQIQHLEEAGRDGDIQVAGEVVQGGEYEPPYLGREA
ncbi:hypothetical protein ABW19_dt0210519 [Dactylella cylindrospora]|nr:hypothetical protein ABW19_dt0210519 [Dactylella cylindrospora]